MKYGKGESRHRYEIRACRRVRAPEYGPDAYFIDTKEESFPFGKGKEYADGQSAKLAALARALELMPLASEVSVWKCNGYGGHGSYMKQSDELYVGRWSDVVAA